jgi:hypothetical protein
MSKPRLMTELRVQLPTSPSSPSRLRDRTPTPAVRLGEIVENQVVFSPRVAQAVGLRAGEATLASVGVIENAVRER